ncbi:hypothetical protein VDG1235_1338 [Verrucomicrobiia bacterium DG1235]|nr:hypothetical protein VDG1235_1338 [Verrucomicrobiae bacterium DG1235]
MTHPCSPFDALGGLIYFPRMLDKIRLKQRGELAESYLPLLGKGFDGRLCGYLGISYGEVVEKVEAGATDDEILDWTRSEGVPLNETHVLIWNGFSVKRGWDDDGTPVLDGFKKELGIEDRDDVRSFLDYIEVEEGRRP